MDDFEVISGFCLLAAKFGRPPAIMNIGVAPRNSFARKKWEFEKLSMNFEYLLSHRKLPHAKCPFLMGFPADYCAGGKQEICTKKV